MKKCLFIVLALFGLNAFSDMNQGIDHMSNMVAEEGESGLMGSFSLRYKPIGFEEEADELTYRARVGWMGDINEAVKWAVSFGTATEQSFGGIRVEDSINLEQAYVTYSPMEGFSIKVGKYGWLPDFHKLGILYSEQLYKTGALLKYKHEMGDMAGLYAKVGFYDLTENEPLSDGITAKVKAGGYFDVSDGMALGLYVSALHDGLMKEEGSSEAKTLAHLGVNFDVSSMPVPIGFFVAYFTDADGLAEFNSYSAGVSVGGAGKANSTEMGDFGVAVNYYKIDANDLIVSWLNEDYVDGAGTGVAVRGQYNPWDNTSFVLKYAHNLGDSAEEASNLVAELMFVF